MAVKSLRKIFSKTFFLKLADHKLIFANSKSVLVIVVFSKGTKIVLVHSFIFKDWLYGDSFP